MRYSQAKRVMEAVHKIEAELLDRRSIKHVWREIREDNRQAYREIVRSWFDTIALSGCVCRRERETSARSTTASPSEE